MSSATRTQPPASAPTVRYCPAVDSWLSQTNAGRRDGKGRSRPAHPAAKPARARVTDAEFEDIGLPLPFDDAVPNPRCAVDQTGDETVSEAPVIAGSDTEGQARAGDPAPTTAPPAEVAEQPQLTGDALLSAALTRDPVDGLAAGDSGEAGAAMSTVPATVAEAPSASCAPPEPPASEAAPSPTVVTGSSLMLPPLHVVKELVRALAPLLWKSIPVQ
jgi:hypothetical protein